MYLAAAEIGGTKLQVAIGTDGGKLVAIERTVVKAGWDAAEIRDEVSALLTQAMSRAGVESRDVAAIGVGFGGPVDVDRGIVIKSHHVPGWDGFPLVEWFRDVWGLRAIVHNDADTAGLGEAVWGAGRGYDPLFYITLGTGVGGGLIYRGEIYRGCGLGAGEIGHLKVLPRDPSNLQGDWYITEDLASGRGIAEQAKQRVQNAPQRAPVLLELCHGEPRDIRGETVAQAAERGDEVAREVVRLAVEALARAICHAIALICPARIVIGGGASRLGEELLFAPLRRRVAELVFPPFASCCDIVPSALGTEVVLYGGLELARRSVSSARR